MNSRTLEQQIKFDSNLSVGVQHVEITRRDGSTYEAVVEISSRGKVMILPKPNDSDMYTSWYQVKGNELKILNTVVWMSRDLEAMKIFSGIVGKVRII